MVADRQTHALPESPAESHAFATFMGFPPPTAFADALLTASPGSGRATPRCSSKYRNCWMSRRRGRRWISVRRARRKKRWRHCAAWALPSPPVSSMRSRALAGRACARVPLAAGARADGPDAAGVAGVRSGRSRIRMRPSLGSTRSSPISPPACSFCPCSSAIRPCWNGWRRCSVPRPHSPTTWRSIRRRWRACCRRRRTKRRPLLRSRLRDARLWRT